LNLGICRLREGRTATAFAVLSEALSQARAAGRADRVATAERHLAELAPIISRIVVRVSGEAPPPDLVIEIDGKPLAHTDLGVALPYDPGPHRIRASRPGHVARDFELSLGSNADVQNVELLPLEAETASPPAVIAAPPVAPKGGAAILAGSYFGVRAFSLKAKSDEYYKNGNCTRQSCVDDWEEAKTAAAISNVGIGLGVATLGVGVYLLMSSPTKEHPSASATFSVRTSRNGATATGTFEF